MINYSFLSSNISQYVYQYMLFQLFYYQTNVFCAASDSGIRQKLPVFSILQFNKRKRITVTVIRFNFNRCKNTYYNVIKYISLIYRYLHEFFSRKIFAFIKKSYFSAVVTLKGIIFSVIINKCRAIIACNSRTLSAFY